MYIIEILLYVSLLIEQFAIKEAAPVNLLLERVKEGVCFRVCFFMVPQQVFGVIG